VSEQLELPFEEGVSYAPLVAYGREVRRRGPVPAASAFREAIAEPKAEGQVVVVETLPDGKYVVVYEYEFKEKETACTSA
jgi:hypothetical protein